MKASSQNVTSIKHKLTLKRKKEEKTKQTKKQKQKTAQGKKHQQPKTQDAQMYSEWGSYLILLVISGFSVDLEDGSKSSKLVWGAKAPEQRL